MPSKGQRVAKRQSQLRRRRKRDAQQEYDFDVDFETTDRRVCTELIFRTYDGILEIPPMRSIMGKPRIAANDYVRLWANGLESDDPQLELVRFLDFGEPNAETLIGTVERSRFTFMN